MVIIIAMENHHNLGPNVLVWLAHLEKVKQGIINRLKVKDQLIRVGYLSYILDLDVGGYSLRYP